MKTMMKKCGVFAPFAAVLLVMAVLVTGCPAPDSDSPGHQPPAGMGSVQLIFNETIERATILPASATIASFPEFVLTFTAAGGGAVSQTVTRANAARDTPVNLVPGSYDVQVVAHLTAGNAASAAAIWSSGTGTPLNITTGNTTSLAITLKPYDPAAATQPGTFAWSITNSITGTLQTGSELKLTTLAGGAAGGGWSDVNLTTPANLINTTGVSVPSNYYYVDITLIANGVTRDFRHVLHIYQNMTSTFSYAFTDDHIGITLITFTPTITYVHPTDTPPTISTTPVSVASNPVAGNGTVATPYLLSIGDATYPTGLTITVSNAGTFTGGVKYYLGSTVLSSVSPYTISTATAPFNTTGGPYQITVEGIVGATGGVPYYMEIFVKVAP